MINITWKIKENKEKKHTSTTVIEILTKARIARADIRLGACRIVRARRANGFFFFGKILERWIRRIKDRLILRVSQLVPFHPAVQLHFPGEIHFPFPHPPEQMAIVNEII